MDLLGNLSYREIGARGLTEETCRKFGYAIGEMVHPKTGKTQSVQVANYRDKDNIVVAQKIRFADKEMKFLNGKSNGPLFGMHLWKKGGKRLVITEGEIDAMSISQVQNNTWPVVSIPNGATAASKSISANIEFVESFDEVVFCFDMDEPGRKAASECAALLDPGRAFVCSLPLKDANEMLQAGKVKELRDAVWQAKEFRPDGVLRVADLLDRALKPVEWGDPWFDKRLTKLTYGRRLGELYALGAGTGVGKTDWFTQQITYDINELGHSCGLFLLEQDPAETVKRIAGKIAGKRFHIPDGGWTVDELKTTVEAMNNDDRLFIYDNFGATDWKVIRTTIKFLALSNGVKHFYLDHLTALAAAEDKEREALERIMSEMAMLAKELQVIIHFVSHLATPDGKPHEEGGRVMIRHFKGSRSIGFWSHFMFGMERDQQAEDESERHTTTFRCLKDRYTGQSVGSTLYLRYNENTGILESSDSTEATDCFELSEELEDKPNMALSRDF